MAWRRDAPDGCDFSAAMLRKDAPGRHAAIRK